MGRPNPSRESNFSGANGNWETFIFPVELTTSRIANLTRLIHTLLYVMTIHTYMMQPNKVKLFPGATVPKAGTPPPRKTWDPKRVESKCSEVARECCKLKCRRRWRSRGVVGVLHPTRRKNQGKNLGRQWHLLHQSNRTEPRADDIWYWQEKEEKKTTSLL